MASPSSSAERTALYQTLTSPVRRKILEHIGREREANSTSVARALGESTGTTSYHLRKLAEQRLIEEVPERSGGRERWWRLLPVNHVAAAPGDRTPEEEAAFAEWNRQRLSADIELFTRAMTEYEGPHGWVQAQRADAWMTREGLIAFYREYLALRDKYGLPEGAPGARHIALRFLAIPRDPGER